MASEEKVYRYERCGRSITDEEYELYD